MGTPEYLALTFVDPGISARARLLWEVAPRTCEAVIACLPSRGEAHHAIYSGSECVHLLQQIPRVERENATSQVRPGQVAFTWMKAGSSYGVQQDFAEICWFYDLDAAPRMWEGPVEVNVFAELVGNPAEFFAECRRMRHAGVQAFAVTVAAA